ncbi:capsular biosynthesis protein, partial [Vibrio parahaemolyticus]
MIIIPMAGMSSRFFKAGYDKPKYMLEAHGKTLFEHSVESFEALFLDTKFLFIVKDVYNTK